MWTFGLAAALSFLVAGGALSYSGFQALQNQMLIRHQAIATRAEDNVSAFLAGLDRELEISVTLGNGDLTRIGQHVSTLIEQNPAFLEGIVVDRQANILGGHARDEAILQEASSIGQSSWFLRAYQGERYLSTLLVSSSDQPYAVLGQPILGAQQMVGAVAVRIDMRAVWSEVAALDVGSSGEAYIIDDTGLIIAHAVPSVAMSGSNLFDNPGFASLFRAPAGTVHIFQGRSGQRSYGAAVPIGSTRFLLITEVPAREAEAPLTRSLVTFAALLLTGLVIVVLVAWLLGRQIAGPVLALAAAAEQIGSGDLTARARVNSEDEMGLLAVTFNNMIGRLEELLTGLEQRVAERTRALTASISVSQRLSTILTTEQLVSEVVEQVKVAFDYYHTHIYLFDEKEQQLIMVGGTGEAGQVMLVAGHRLRPGEGLVGHAASTGQVMLAPDVTREPHWLSNPLLPDTRAEVAVPIVLGDKVVGVLDVQHDVCGALTENDAALLQSIASQVAITLRNAQLYEEAQLQAQQEGLINLISQQIEKASTVEDVLRIAAQELGQALGAEHTGVHLEAPTQPHTGTG